MTYSSASSRILIDFFEFRFCEKICSTQISTSYSCGVGQSSSFSRKVRFRLNKTEQSERVKVNLKEFFETISEEGDRGYS